MWAEEFPPPLFFQSDQFNSRPLEAITFLYQ